MKVYVCERSEHGHDGALLIAARYMAEAHRLYSEHENYHSKSPIHKVPYDTRELANVTCIGKPGVIYDDYSR